MARETGVIRKRLSGQEAAPYMGMARTLLGGMKNRMQLGGLQQLKQTINLPNGTEITVSSIFGNDTVQIFVPVPVSAPVKRLRQHRKDSRGYLVAGAGQLGCFYYDSLVGKPVMLPPQALSVTCISKTGVLTIGGATTDGKPYLWTAATGLVAISQLQGKVDAISDDGSIASGTIAQAVQYQNISAFTYSNGTLSTLGTFDNVFTGPLPTFLMPGITNGEDISLCLISGNGARLACSMSVFSVSFTCAANGTGIVFLEPNFFNPTMVQYGYVAAYQYSGLVGIDYAGDVLVGWVTETVTSWHSPAKWGATGNLTKLGTATVNSYPFVTTGVDGNGSVIVGSKYDDATGTIQSGWIWDVKNLFVPVIPPVGYDRWSEVVAVDSTGIGVAGYGKSGTAPYDLKTFVWSQASGLLIPNLTINQYITCISRWAYSYTVDNVEVEKSEWDRYPQSWEEEGE